MLAVVNKILCFLIMYTTGYFVIKKITGESPKLTKLTYMYLILLGLVSVYQYQVEFQTIYTLIIFMLNIVVYKKVFNISLSQATIAVGIFMLVMTLSDVLITPFLRIFYTHETIRQDFIASIVANGTIGITSILIINIKFILNKVRNFYKNLYSRKSIINIIYLLVLMVAFCYILYNFASNPIDKTYISNLVILVSFSVITYIYIDSKNDYKVLSDEYDNLFKYVQNFEDWIEKEQLNRHEYKNQLAVLRTLAKDKKIKEKIDEILDDNINIKDEVVNKLNELPKGGLKGLLYYKAVIAKKNKINFVVDISLKRNSKLKKLNENQLKTICKLIGIYFDNAIEAAAETKSKYLLLEVYELSDKINIVISNAFVMKDNFDNRNKKGVSTKGIGRGNGLYYANNIISKNKWLKSKQEVIDNYYIQTLSIKKLD